MKSRKVFLLIVAALLFLNTANAERPAYLSLCKYDPKVVFAKYSSRTETWACSTNRNPNSISLAGCSKVPQYKAYLYCIAPMYGFCSEKVLWWHGHNQVMKTATYDLATDSCLVFNIPLPPLKQPGQPFVWNNNYYTKALVPGTETCLYGKWDGANCWLGTPPAGKTAILKAGKFYHSK